jgi:hypothetical protein
MLLSPFSSFSVEPMEACEKYIKPFVFLSVVSVMKIGGLMN